VTTHCFSLNLDLDLVGYRTFDPCGLGGAPFTTVSKELGRTVPVAEARPIVARSFGEVFEIEFEERPAVA
jgi:lipoyl(octanoyl) transferase